MSETVNQFEQIDVNGPWPFFTRRIYRRPDGSVFVKRSRHHRKGLHPAKVSMLVTDGSALVRCLWMPQQLNWWIGIIFAVGSLLFVAASVFFLMPALATARSLDATQINAIFFAGSFPFTIAAYLQLFQAANASDFSLQGGSGPRRVVWFGWRPHDIGWLSCALQFLGTLAFNLNTFDAMLPGLTWVQQDLAIWIPNFVGSVLFLSSGYLAFIETCHAHWAWKPTNLSWWVTFVNLLGCVGFMISALFAFVLPQLPSFDAATISVTFTLLGAIGFLSGSLMMLPESAFAEAHRAIDNRG